MFGHKHALQKRHAVIVDMIDFLMTYASQKLGFRNDLAQLIVQAGQQNITGLDSLFKDHGYGRTQRFLDIGAGAISDSLDPTQRNLAQIKQSANQLGRVAMNYLAKHQSYFNHWLLD